MSEALLQNAPSMSQTFFGAPQFVGHLGDILTTQVLQFAAFEQVPDAFLRVQFRRIAWQAFQMETFGCASFEKVLDDLCAMDRRAIPDHQQLARDLTQQQAQQAHHLLSIVGMILRLHEEFAIGTDRADGREMIAGQLHPQDGRLPTRGVGAHRHGQ